MPRDHDARSGRSQCPIRAITMPDPGDHDARSGRSRWSDPRDHDRPTRAVRSLPTATTAKEAVEKAKAAGIVLSENYFYNVRATDKTGAKKTKAMTTKPATTKRTGANGTSSASTETAFRRMVLDLGLAWAKALLGEVERGLQAVIAGR